MRIVRRRERFQQPMTIHIASLEVITVGGIRPVEARDAGSLCAGLLYRREIASVIDGIAIDEGFPTCQTHREWVRRFKAPIRILIPQDVKCSRVDRKSTRLNSSH